MNTLFRRAHDVLYRLLVSPLFFYAIVLLLVLQAAWIALTARYPMPFDENFHFTLIQMHARQWLPFFTSQPPDAAVNGAVVRDPSYLYHYLFSLPYRLIVHITSQLNIQVVILRFMNIALFASGLLVYRRLFREIGISSAVSNVVLLFFVLLPVVPTLAGQINYDNLMFVFSGLLFVYVQRYVAWLRSADNQPFPLALSLKFLIIGMLGCIVTFPFAPIFFMALAVLIVLSWRRARRVSIGSTTSWRSRASVAVRPALRAVPKWRLVLLLALTVISLGLLMERYGLNTVQYKTPLPKCDKVLSVDECLQYSPWARDFQFSQTYPSPKPLGIIVYPFVWAHRMVYETLFSITSYFYEPAHTVTYAPSPPLTFANYTAWTVIVVAAIALIFSWRLIWRHFSLRLLLIISLFYAVVLFLQNLQMYLYAGEAVAIHGRYFVPIYPILLLAMVLGLRELLQRLRLQLYAPLITVVVLLCFLQGGGIVGWIVRSDPSWYWQASPAAAQANWWAKDVLKYTTIN